MTRTYSQTNRTDNYSQLSLIIWLVWLNDWMFVYELSGCGLESSCSHLNFRFRACLEHGIPWHSGNYRVWIHSEMCIWHDRNIESKVFCLFLCKSEEMTFRNNEIRFQQVCSTYICCIFREYPFMRKPMGDCLWYFFLDNTSLIK